MPRGKLTKVTGTILLLIATLIWGSSFVVSKSIIGAIPSGWLVSLRFFIAFLVMLAVSRRKLSLLNGEYLRRGAVLGLLHGAGMLFQNYGIQYTTAGKSAFLTAAYCVLVPFVAWLLMKKRPTVRNLIAALVAIVGIALVSLTERFTMEKGDYLVLLCSVLFSFHIVYLTISVGRLDATLLVTVQFLLSGLVTLLFSLLFEPLPVIRGASAWAGVLYLGIFCTAVALLFQSLSQRVLPPSTVSLFLCFEAAFGAIFSAIFFRETFTARADRLCAHSIRRDRQRMARPQKSAKRPFVTETHRA